MIGDRRLAAPGISGYDETQSSPPLSAILVISSALGGAALFYDLDSFFRFFPGDLDVVVVIVSKLVFGEEFGVNPLILLEVVHLRPSYSPLLVTAHNADWPRTEVAELEVEA